MRNVILTAVFLLTAGSAMASSIETIDSKTSDNAGSIITRKCSDCQAGKPEIAKQIYKVPELKSGTQTTVVKQIDGEQKVVRTEAWMGGSPVVFISKASPEALAAANMPTDGIDRSTMTGAVDSAPRPAPIVVAPLDTSSFQLRAN